MAADPVLYVLPEEVRIPEGTGRYTPEQKDKIMLAVIMAGGNTRSVAKQLGLNRNGVKSIVERNRQRYDELAGKYGPELERRAVQGLQSYVVAAEEVKALLLDELRRQVEEGELSDPGKALQQISVSQGISVQKILELSGRPSQIIEHRSLNETMARLRALGAEVIDGDADVVSSDEPEQRQLPQEAATDGQRNDTQPPERAVASS